MPYPSSPGRDIERGLPLDPLPPYQQATTPAAEDVGADGDKSVEGCYCSCTFSVDALFWLVIAVLFVMVLWTSYCFP